MSDLRDEIRKAIRQPKTTRTIFVDCIAYDDGSHGVAIRVPSGMGLFTAFGCLEHAARKLNMGLLTDSAKIGEPS